MKEKKLIGYCGVDSGQILLTDPCYLSDWKDNEFKQNENKNDFPCNNFSYNGACHVSLKKDRGGQLLNDIGREVGVCISSGGGDGVYPVYVEYSAGGRIKRAIIEFLD